MICPSCGQTNRESATFCDTCGARLLVDSREITSFQTQFDTSSDFVGRQRELGELQEALDGVLAGQGRLVMLMGEPGIGKTRIVQELATLADTRGAEVLWGRCYEERGVPPFWPWVQVLRSYVREHTPEELLHDLGAGAATIAEIVTDVNSKLPDLSPLPPLDSPEQTRFWLFDAVTTFLKTAAQRQPLVLILDDLHWADQPSLLLLQFITRELGGERMLLVGTYRDVELSRKHPLAETLGELTRERLFQRVQLRGLSQVEVARYLEVTTGTSPPDQLVEAVFTQTEGNPLFVTEVVRLLDQEKKLAGAEGSPSAIPGGTSSNLRIPEGVREVIGRRLNRLSTECNETLSIASIIGREFSLVQLDSLFEQLTEDRLLDVLEEAREAKVIEELPHEIGRYQFTHVLIQETIAGELSLTRRVRLHARIAQNLEDLYGDSVEAHAAELAHHFGEAQSMLGAEKLVKYTLLAGERALAFYAYEEALSYFQRALSAKEGQEMDDEKAALLFGLGRAQGAIFGQNLEESGSTLGHAFEYYAGAGEIDNALRVAEYPLDPYPGTRTGTANLLARALELSPPGSLQAGRFSSRLARVLAIEEGEYEAAQKAFDTALGIARREGDASLEMQTLANAGQSELNQLRFRQSLELTARSMGLAPRAREYRAEALAHHMAGMALIALGDPVAAQEHASLLLTLAEQLRNRYFISSASGTKAMAAGLVGDWVHSRRFGEESLTAAPMDPRTLGLRIMVEYEVGNLGHGETFLERLLETMRTTSQEGSVANAYIAFVLPAINRLTGVTDRLEAAQQTAHAVVSSNSTTPLLIHAAQTGLALLAIQRDDASAAGMQYGILVSTRASIPTIVFTSCDRILGLLAQTMGNPAKACEHFEDSLTFCRKAGYRPELAWTCCDYADTLIQRNNPGDRERAASLLDESRVISTELGMRPLMERVLSRIEQLGSAPIMAPSYPDGLSEREVQVLRLIAAGKTNRDIAEELIISPRTVANHVTNILNKTNAANRTEAATYASQHQLV